jgi:hypothetical protein
MQCCGPGRAAASGSGNLAKLAERRRPAQSLVLYEYTGATGMTVRGPRSGHSYRFGHPGAQVAIDPRDVASLAGVPNLRRV